MLKTIDAPISSISKLKKSPTKLFDEAKKVKSGIYIFNRDTPSGVVMSVHDYENMVHKIDQLREELLDMEAANRLKTNKKTYSDHEVRGKKADNSEISLDDNDGWE